MLRSVVTAMALAAFGIACSPSQVSAATQEVDLRQGPHAKALFAGGCFWCMEPPFDDTEGVIATISGYAGGSERSPSYHDVAAGKTGHVEAVLVEYDPKKVSYDKLVEVFWRSINPTQADGQFYDIGSQYKTVIFYLNEQEKAMAEVSKKRLEASGKLPGPVATTIRPATTFWRAEEYHQDFYKKDPDRYYSYRSGSGRDAFIEKIWGIKPKSRARGH